MSNPWFELPGLLMSPYKQFKSFCMFSIPSFLAVQTVTELFVAKPFFCYASQKLYHFSLLEHVSIPQAISATPPSTHQISQHSLSESGSIITFVLTLN